MVANATFLPKQSEKQTAASSKTDEQKAAEESARKAAVRARGNNGAKRKDYFTVDTVEEDVYPENVDANACIEIGVRDVIRYEITVFTAMSISTG